MAVHVTFRTPNFSQAEFILRRSAGRFGIDDVRCYLPEHPAVQLARSANPLIMAFPRGAGYWLWKPYIILDALRSAPPGMAVLYTDVAVTYVADPAPLFSLLQIDDIILFENWPFNLQRGWTKRHSFIRLDADSPEFWNRRQLDAAFQLYRAGPRAIEFLEATREAMRDPRVMIDTKNVSETKELDGYSEHRHDQSVLTIMAQKWGIRSFSRAFAPARDGRGRRSSGAVRTAVPPASATEHDEIAILVEQGQRGLRRPLFQAEKHGFSSAVAGQR
jgi:hypothetical protein